MPQKKRCVSCWWTWRVTIALFKLIMIWLCISSHKQPISGRWSKISKRTLNIQTCTLLLECWMSCDDECKLLVGVYLYVTWSRYQGGNQTLKQYSCLEFCCEKAGVEDYEVSDRIGSLLALRIILISVFWNLLKSLQTTVGRSEKETKVTSQVSTCDHTRVFVASTVRNLWTVPTHLRYKYDVLQIIEDLLLLRKELSNITPRYNRSVSNISLI